ncbi:inositol monophosphatase family protein [Streptomyces canus]|uniref:inositol monophosphatase family protein n=1 Tax=Streptomyces canus TaxID=58343 RepID=UPI0027D8AD05|nr:inositol monophosphatase family protein [Streptomyces canus]
MAASAAQTRPALDWAAPQPTCLPPPKPSTGSGTCHGALLVAMGHLDAFHLLGADPWDIPALVPIIKEAGGAFSHLFRTREKNRQVALFSNVSLHRQIVEIAQSAS